jgi:endonuclease/exonuclease/phosphatase family metal-dependent hydrolase
MTRNLYVGAAIEEIFSPDLPPDELPFKAAELFGKILATDFEERAAAIAEEVADKQPHVIGLQEVSLFRLQSPSDAVLGGEAPATEPVIDFLAILLDALEARGLAYEVASSVENFDAEVPMFYPEAGALPFADIRLTDYDVILARSDVAYAEATGANYAVNLPVEVAGQALELERGWTSIQATVRGFTFRFVNTHLEPADFSSEVQVAQAAELLGILSAETTPTVLVGDLNSSPDGTPTPAARSFLEAGFQDAWAPKGGGSTCCQEPSLRSSVSTLEKRFDLVFLRGFQLFEPDVRGSVHATMVGALKSDRTPSGLWPSDHAGVVANVQLPPRAAAR